MAERIPDAPMGWEKLGKLHFRHTASGMYLSTRHLKEWGDKTMYELSLWYTEDYTPPKSRMDGQDWFKSETRLTARFFTERGFPPSVFEWALSIAANASNNVLASAKIKRDILDHAIERKEWRG